MVRIIASISLCILANCVYAQEEPTSTAEGRERVLQQLQVVTQQAETVAAVPHPLHEYFAESIGIIQRLAKYIQEDLKTGKPVRAKQGLEEARFLTTFLQEEIEVARKSEQATWQEFVVTKHGLKGDGKFDNGPAFRKLLEKCNDDYQRIVFPAGQYYFGNVKGRSTIELEGLKNVCLEGQGRVRFLCDARMGSGNNIRIQDCENITFRNLILDNRPVPYTLGTITKVLNGNQIEIEIRPEHLLPDESYQKAKFLRGLVHTPLTGRIRRDCGDPRVIGLEKIEGRTYRLTLDNNALSGAKDLTQNFSEGLLFSVHPRQRPGAGNAVTIVQSRHVLFSRVDLRSADTMLCAVITSAGVKFMDCNLEPEPGRMILNNADGFHCRSNSKGIYLERCRVLYMNDDCLNFYSGLASVGQVQQDKKFTLLVTEHQNRTGPNFKIGDPIAFVNSNTGEFDGVTTIRDIEVVQWGDRKEGVLRLVTTDAIPGIRGRREVGRADRIKPREYVPSGAYNYRAAMAIKAPFEHMILNLKAKNDGFIVRNCEMGHNRATGFKCKATNGVLRNTRFHDQVVLFKTGIDWHEGTYPANIEITDVIADRGIHFGASLPGKGLGKKDVARFMPRIHFERCYDAQGNALSAP